MVDVSELSRGGERVRLRPVEDGDLDDLVTAADDPEIARWTDLPHPYSREHGAQFIALAQEEARVDKSFHMAIATIDEDRLVGMAALSNVDLESRNAEIGIWLGREMWGEGVAFEAFDLLLEIAFDRLELTKLYGVVLEGNEASIDLFKRYGFHEEGRLRWHTLREGEWMDKIFFGFLREEWERRTGRA